MVRVMRPSGESNYDICCVGRTRITTHNSAPPPVYCGRGLSRGGVVLLSHNGWRAITRFAPAQPECAWTCSQISKKGTSWRSSSTSHYDRSHALRVRKGTVSLRKKKTCEKDKQYSVDIVDPQLNGFGVHLSFLPTLAASFSGAADASSSSL